VARGPVAVEAVAVGAGAAALGGLVLAPVGLAPVGAVIAGANGVISGWRGIYDWRHASGWVAAALDSTWGLVGTTGSLAVHVVSRVGRDADYLAELSARKSRHVYRYGFSPRKRFAFTVGNTITNARDIELSRRRALVERHEDLHVWQQRWFGPVFPVVYAAWMVGGAITGSVAWLRRRDAPYAVFVERHAYYYNPFERWAYAADDNWPPRSMLRRRLSRSGSGGR
jgi:hypothetical protein